MKLAEALQERADLNRKIEALQTRLLNNCLVQEGEKTAEDPAELLFELNACTARLSSLISMINLKNALTICEGKTLTEMLAEKDALQQRLSIYRDIINTASQTVRRARGTEIRIMAAVDVRDLQKQADDMAKKLRLLDNKIQQINWTTEF